MAWGIYLCPMVGAGTIQEPFHVKHQYDAGIDRAGSIRFSRDDDAVGSFEGSAAALSVIDADAECLKLADATSIDNTIGTGQRNAVRSFLESKGIPGLWVNVGETRRQIIRGVIGMFLFAQRLEGRFGEGLKARAAGRGITLGSTWSSFPQALKDELIAVRNDHGWTNTELGVTNASTLREILKSAGDQFQSERIFIGGFEI